MGFQKQEPHFDQYQFQNIAAKRFVGGNEVEGLSFEDVRSGMQVRNRPLFNGRQPNPLFFNAELVRQTIVRAIERKAGFKGPLIGSYSERLKLAERRLRLHVIPDWQARLDEFCREYVRLKNAGASRQQLRRLEIRIQGADGTIRTARGGPALLAAMIHFFYRLGWNSVQIGQQFRLQPGAVRQTMFKMKLLAERIAAGKDDPVSSIEIKRAAARAKVHKNPAAASERVKSWYMGLSPERKAERRQYLRDWRAKHLAAEVERERQRKIEKGLLVTREPKLPKPPTEKLQRIPRSEREARGLCRHCGGAFPEAGRKNCKRCAAKLNDKNKRCLAKKKISPACECGNPAGIQAAGLR